MKLLDTMSRGFDHWAAIIELVTQWRRDDGDDATSDEICQMLILSGESVAPVVIAVVPA
ncbi:hypothetical protein ACFL1S_00225 [Pseudomonadota bacterium]